MAVHRSPLPIVATLRPIVWTVLLTLGMVHVATAQIVADHAAGRGPGVTAAPNGVPLVNIHAPSGAGVSHNQYQQFSVDGRGAILNNATSIHSTQLGGYVAGNSNLGASGPARVILNEVTGARPSQLNGYVEIAGQRADLVIANPNGISINGGGFVNANRATLTTGAPVFGGDGSLAAFRVTRGAISVDGQGFNGTNLDQVDLLARSVTLNGQLWANDANVITGANRVDYTDLGVQVLDGEGERPTVAIDVANLGGMYASRIRMVGTEAGVGVRSAGTLAAQAGDFTIDGAGRVLLAGNTSATGAMTVRGAQGIDNTGTAASRAAMTLASDGHIRNSGSLIAGKDLALSAQSVRSTGTLAAGIDADGNANQAGNLRITTTQSAMATGHNLAGSSLAIEGSAIDLSGSRTQANDGVSLNARDGAITLSDASISTGRALRAQAQAQGTVDTNRASVTASTIDVTAQGMRNRSGSLLAQQGARIAMRGDIDNAGGSIVTDAGALDVSSGGTIDNTSGRLTNAGTGRTNISAELLRNSNREGVAGAGALGGNGDVAINARKLTNTDGGQLIAGNDLRLDVTTSAVNARGGIYAGNQLVVSGTQGAWRNDSGTISGKTVQFDAGSMSNRHGTLAADGDMRVRVDGDIDNQGGTLQATGTMLVETDGELVNDDGRVVNIGTGDTQIAATTIANNGRAVLGGNGDVNVAARRIANMRGAQLTSGKALVIRAAETFDNAGGKTYAGTGLKIEAQRALIRNEGGSLAAGTSAMIRASRIDNVAGKVLADADIDIDTGVLSGIGAIHAGRDLALTLGGDYVNAQGNLLRAERNLAIRTTGFFTNQTRLEAVRALTLDAAGIANEADAIIHAGSTELTTTGALDNAGRIEGDTLTTRSDALANSGTLLADTLTSHARTIHNDGASAVMAATETLNLYGRTLVSNTNGATFYSLGDINIAADGERDERGLLRNRAARVVNDSSTIEGGSSHSVVEIAAEQIVNERPAPVIEADTTTETKRERKREKYIACATTNAYPQMGCTWEVWNGPYKTSIDGTFEASQIVSHDVEKRRLIVNVAGIAMQIDYNTLTESDGVLSVNYWDGYDRDVHYDPASEYATRNDRARSRQRVEITRDTTTTITTERDTNPDQRRASLISGGDMILANVGSLANAYSEIAAGGNMLIGDLAQTGDVASGQYGFTNVENTGRTLQRRTRQDIVSTYAWNKDPNREVGEVVQPSVILAPEDVGSVGGTITAGRRMTIFGGGVRNEDVGKLDPMSGTASTTLTGAKVATRGVEKVSLANTPLTLPSNGLFTYRSEPGTPYLVESDPRFTRYGNFVSSDYMLGLLGIDPSMAQKRLGDGFYEQKLIRDQVTELSGRVYLSGYDNAEDQYRALMTSGVHASKAFNIMPGMALTDAQMSALTTDIVWLVSETVTLPDGSTQTVTVPRVYLAQANATDLKPSGALIAADDIELRDAGSMRNSGVIDARSRLSIAASNDVINRGGTIRSAGITAISAGGSIVNQSGRIGGNKVGLVASGSIRNETLFDQQGVTHAADNSSSSASVFGQQAAIASTGDLLLSAGRDIAMTGAMLEAGGNATVAAGQNLTLDALAGKTQQSVYSSAKHNSADSNLTHAVSTVQAGGSLTTTSGGDTTLRGAKVQAGADLAMIASGNFSANAVTDERTHDNVARQSRKGQREDHSRDQTTLGASLSAGGNVTLAAVKATDQGGGLDRTDGKGNVELIGAKVVAGTDGKGDGALTIVADRDVTVAEARELHDSSVDIQSRRGSFVRRTSTSLQTSRSADLGVGSTLSGDSVKVQAGNDLLVRQSDISGTNGVALTATQGNVLVTAGQNIREESHSQSTKTMGVSAFAGQGGIGVGVGSSRTNSAGRTLAVTQSDARSMVGASNGNVVMTAGKDATIIGSDLVAGRKSDVADAAAGNIEIRAKNVQIAEGVDRIAREASAGSKSSGLSVAVVGTPFDTYKNLQAAQQQESTITRVNDTAKELGASGLTAAQVAASVGSKRSSSQSSSVATVSSGSKLDAAGNIRVRATGNGETDADGRALDGNIVVTGSRINAGGAALLDAEGGVDVRASTDTYTERSATRSSGWRISDATPSLGDVARHIGGGSNNSGVGMVPIGTERADGSRERSSSQQNASVITGNTVGIRARSGDIALAGSGVAAEGDIALSAAQGRIDILSGQDTLTQRSDSSSRKVGDLGGSGYSGTVGVRSESHHTDGTQATQNTIRSQIVSKTGNVSIVAKDTVAARGADISADTDVTLIGSNVDFNPGSDAASQNERHRVSQYGSTLALSGYTVSAAQAVENAARAVEEKKDSRVATLYGLQAGLAVMNGLQGLQAVTSGGATSTAAIKVTASVGGGTQSSESRSQASTNQGTTVKAGNAVTIVATGSGGKDAEGFATDGTVSGQGVQISGRTVGLSAARDVDLESAQDRSKLKGRSGGSNASVGVGLGVLGDQNGFTLELSASQNKAKANGESVTNRNSRVTATDTLRITSGRDTNLRGAQLIADTVEASVGRDLNIESRPDTETYISRETSSGMQASICVPPFCYGTTAKVSGNFASGKTESTYSSVREQSGIYAGKGGFDVKVQGNTDLKGAALASTADASKSSLSTGTLATSDIENKAEYTSGSSAFAASYSGGSSVPADTPDVGPASPAVVKWGENTNLLQGAASSLAATAAGNAQKDLSGNASGTTKSAIAEGTIRINDDAGQLALTGKSVDETLATLNRDTEGANQSIEKIFDAEKVREQQELNRLKSEVAQQAAPLIYGVVGDLVEGQSTGTKVAVHALIGGLMTEAMGGNFIAGAAGDAAATAAAEMVGQQIVNNPDLQGMSEDDRKALVQIAGTIIAAGAGSAVGGSTQDAAAAGAVGGLGTQFNWMQHAPGLGGKNSGPSPFPADPQEPSSPPGKPIHDGGERLLTGTPDESGANNKPPMYQPIADAVDRLTLVSDLIAAVVQGVLPNPLEPVKGLGAIFAGREKGEKSTGGLGDSGAVSSDTGQQIPVLDMGKQGKHVPSHNNFIPGRSEVTHPDPQALIEKYAGRGEPVNDVPKGKPGYKERLDFGVEIGSFVNQSGKIVPTTKGIIHYGKSGVHIVPSRP